MNSGTFLTLFLLAAGAGVATYEYVPEVQNFFNGKPALASKAKSAKAAKTAKNTKGKKADKAPARPLPSVIPGSYIGNELSGKEWADSPALQKTLAEKILSRLKSTDTASVKTFIAEPANRLLLAQWHLAAAENATPEKERDTEHSLRETLNTNPSAQKLIRQVTNNLDWMEQIVYTGECRNPGRALSILAAIAGDDKNFAYKKMQREIATATAVEWAKSGWNFDKALARANFYIKNWEDDRLHTEFDSIPFWQRRVICGSKGDNGFGEVASLEWLLDNVNLPTEQYTGCCWQCAYLTHNRFGDSIHGPMFYNPYAETYGDNYAQRAYDVGGVCGALSHYGAFAAIANGIPALTAGEPGHCAYIVFSANRWTPGYSLSWKRGLHWQVWTGVDKFSSLHMATELFSAEQEEATRLGNALWTLGKLHANKDKQKALSLFAAAVEAQPRNYGVWRDYAFFLKDLMPDNAGAWKQLHATVCTGLTPLYPEMAAVLLKGIVYPGMVKARIPVAEVQGELAAFWKGVREMGPDRWDVEGLCGAQANVLKELGLSPEEANLRLYEQALGLCSGKEAYAPVILAWGNGIAAGMKPDMQQKFLKATLSSLSKGGDMDTAARDAMLGQALAGAEKMRDRSSFQAIGKMLSDKYKKNRLPKWEPFPGKLASQGGLMYASSSGHDEPPAHWGVLEPTGGRFHTGRDVDAWVVVELPKTVYVTGVVAISTAGHNNRRINGMKVQYSESGRDDDWHEAGDFPAPSAREVNRLDLGKSKPRARFIRIIRSGGPEFFHLNGIFVYGEQAA